MHASADPNQLNESQLRQLVAQMQQQIDDQDTRLAEQAAIIARRDEAIRRYQIREEQMSHEMALLKRYQFGKRAEGVNRAQFSLLEELVDEDIAGIEREITVDVVEGGQDPAIDRPEPARACRSSWSVIFFSMISRQRARMRFMAEFT